MVLTGVFIAPGLVVGQRFSFGVVGGSAVTSDYSGSGTRTGPFTLADSHGSVTISRTSSSYQPVIGFSVEAMLTDHWSFEADVLRRKSEWRGSDVFNPPLNLNGSLISTLPTDTVQANWEAFCS